MPRHHFAFYREVCGALLLGLATILAISLTGCASLPPLRAMPAVSFAPSDVFLLAEVPLLDVEDNYCPEVRWDFGDGDTSIQESDCPPWTPGTPVQTRFSTRHCYKAPGEHTAYLTLRRARRVLATASTTVLLRWKPARPVC